VKKILILLASVPMLAIPAPAMAQGPPFPHVCPFAAGFLGAEGGELVPDLVTPEEVDKADRNNDGLICYKVEGRSVILIDMLPF
jgi:hypothetical protein